MIDYMSRHATATASLEQRRPLGACKYLCRALEVMRREAAIRSILHDHPDDPLYGWGEYAPFEGKCSFNPEGAIFTIRKYETPFPTITLLILRATVAESPIPLTNYTKEPYTLTSFHSTKRRLMGKTKKIPDAPESLHPSIKGLRLIVIDRIPHITNTPEQIAIQTP